MIAAFALIAAGAQAVAPTPAETPSSQPETVQTAEDAVSRFLAFNKAGQLDSRDAKALFGGELARMPASTLGPLTRPDRTIAIDPDHAATRLPASADNPTDIYLYLSRGPAGAWTIDAIRALALPRFVATMRNDLAQRASRSVEEERTLTGIDLMMRPDARLRDWFALNRAAFDGLRAIAQADAGNGQRRVDGPAARAALDEIGAATLDIDDRGAVVVTIGGVADNAAGFLFTADPAAAPRIDPAGHIWVEPVGGGWFLFKTT